MEIRISLTKQTLKFYIPLFLYILLVLFCVSLAWESYYELEEIAGDIFSYITAGVALAGIPVLWFAKKKSQPKVG